MYEIPIGLTIIGVISLIIYFYFVLNGKYKESIERRKTLITLASNVDPVDGAAGNMGKSAFEIWQHEDWDNRKDLSESYFNGLFTPPDAPDGHDAFTAEIGGPGSTGSLGGVGLGGADGGAGGDGLSGVDGLAGDSFITFDNNSVPSNAADFPTRAIVTVEEGISTESIRTIEYFLKGNLLTTIVVRFNKQNDPMLTFSNGYLAFIIYDNEYNIIGLTEPLTLNNFIRNDPLTTVPLLFDNPTLSSVIITENPSHPLLSPSNNLQYRAILSLNKGSVMSSFTPSIVEKNLMTSSFRYSRKEESSQFVNDFYEIINSNSNISGNINEFNEVVKISETFTANSMAPPQLDVTNFKLGL